jgi:hypothetical protein
VYLSRSIEVGPSDRTSSKKSRRDCFHMHLWRSPWSPHRDSRLGIVAIAWLIMSSRRREAEPILMTRVASTWRIKWRRIFLWSQNNHAPKVEDGFIFSARGSDQQVWIKDTRVVKNFSRTLLSTWSKHCTRLEDELDGLIDAHDEVYRLCLGFMAMESTSATWCNSSTSSSWRMVFSIYRHRWHQSPCCTLDLRSLACYVDLVSWLDVRVVEGVFGKIVH